MAAVVTLLLLALAGGRALWGRRAQPRRAAPSAAEARLRFRRASSAARALLWAERAKCRAVAAALRRAKGAVAPAAATFELPSLPALAGGTALVSTFADGARVHRFVMRGSEVVRLPTLERGALDRRVIVLRDALEHGPIRRDHSALFGRLAEGYRALFGGVERHLAGVSQLVVSMDGMLRFLPLHALVARSSGGARNLRPLFVGERWALSYAACLAFAAGARAAPGQAVVIAPRYGVERRRVAGADDEIAAVRRAYPQTLEVADPLRGRALLRLGLRRDDQTLHYIGHGLADLDDGRSETLLLLGADTEVTVRQLLARAVAPTPRAPLVVLASCSGGYAARFRTPPGASKRAGKGGASNRPGWRLSRTNLAEALLGGGVGTVVAASWAVKTRQSARAMAVFYRWLAAVGPAAAMQRAYRHQIRRIVPPHPRYWGVYAVYGRARWR